MTLPFRVGDVIEVELDYDGHKATLVGEAWQKHPGMVVVGAVAITGDQGFAYKATFVRVVAPALPPEPPDREIVKDRGDYPWHRRQDYWYDTQGNGLDWTELNQSCGPLRLMVPAPDPLAVDDDR